MRLTFLLIVVGLLEVSASVYSQQTKLSMNLNNVTLEDAFRKIEDSSNFVFFYNADQVQLDQRVSLNAENKSIDEILSDLLKDKAISFKVTDRRIILYPENGTIPLALQQALTVSGKVTDTSGAPLLGVSVVVKGTTTGTITDSDGKYTLANTSADATLVFSFVGMKIQEIEVSGKVTVNVKLEEETVGIEEVVAVGYGTQKKVNLTGAVSSLNGENIHGQFSTNTSTLLQGRLPGVNIMNTSGQPGKPNIQILIRGYGTMNDNKPLILVDGIETTMDDINPNDVESVSVLKDASSASIYGSRAGNGVILITTKRGSSGKMRISYNNVTGWQKLSATPKPTSSADYARLLNEARANEGLTPTYSEEQIAKYKNGSDPINYPNTDWLGLLFTGSGFTQTHNLFIGGGNEQVKYGISLGYFDQQGLLTRTDYKRYNARINVDSKVTKWFDVGVNVGLSYGTVGEPASHLLTTGVFYFYQQAVLTPRTILVKNADGEYVPNGNNNLVAMIEQGGGNYTKNPHVVGSMTGEIKLAKGLTLKGLMGVDYNINTIKYHTIALTYSNNVVIGPNAVQDNYNCNQAITLQTFLNYKKTIGKNGIKAMAGISRLSEDYSMISAYRSGFASNDIDQVSAGSASTAIAAGNATETRSGSYFGRLNYDYDSKYLFEANIRRDGSSRFGSSYRWGTFPSFSVGWRMSQESFMKQFSWIEDLKLRGSWGKLGNDRIGDYLYISTITLGQNQPLNGAVQNGAAIVTASSPDIRWETTREWDLGFDVSLFKNRLLALSVDYYSRYTDDILTSVPVSMVYGLSAPVVNAGAMSNKGFEFLLEFRRKFGDVEANLSGNIAFNKNKVEEYANPGISQPQPGGPANIRRLGDPWDAYYGYVNIGKFQTDEEAASSPKMTGTNPKAGDLKYKDLDNSGEIDAYDRTILGNVIPDITYGFHGSISYKNFDLSAVFQGVAEIDASLGIFGGYPFKDDGGALQIHLDRTIVENGKVIKEGHLPRTLLGATNNINGSVFSSWNLYDASYLRMKNVEIGYSLPSTLTERIGIAKARIYFNGQNLLTFTKFPSGFDPEVVSDYGTYNLFNAPQVKAYTFGINVDF